MVGTGTAWSLDDHEALELLIMFASDPFTLLALACLFYGFVWVFFDSDN